MFYHVFPYTDLSEINLDFVLKKLVSLGEANGIKFNNEDTGLTSENVQDAITELNTAINNIADMLTNVAIIDNEMIDSVWTSGQSFNHLQTVNNNTLMLFIDALKKNNYIVFKRFPDSATTDLYIITGREYDSLLIRDRITMINVFTHTNLTLDVFGLNDPDNVYAEILPETTTDYVNSFNGRTGAVTPASGDYGADEITYDNTGSGLTATDVQSAIDEVNNNIPSTLVESFNGRTGAVTPASGDYDADEIPYDNTVSGLTATDVQNALDEIANDVLSSGVASFNSRVGAVLPVLGDYDASLIAIDTSNTDLPGTITNLQEYIEYLHPASVTITLTLNGAMEDTIVIKDSSNNTIGTCVFASGQTMGTITTTVPSGYSDTWSFTSSVAKDTTTGTSDFVKLATVTDASAQTINVMPDNVLYWYGNKLNCVTFRARLGVIYRESHAQIVERTNSIYLDNNSDDGGRKGLMSDTTIDVSAFSSLKMLCETTLNTSNYSYTILDESTSISVWDGNTINEILSDQTEFTKQIKSGTLSATGNKYMIAGNYAGGPVYPIITEIWALWLE